MGDKIQFEAVAPPMCQKCVCECVLGESRAKRVVLYMCTSWFSVGNEDLYRDARRVWFCIYFSSGYAPKRIRGALWTDFCYIYAFSEVNRFTKIND